MREDEAAVCDREERRYIILAIYDIVDQKRRNAMVRFLEGDGIRVQKSAFEAYLTRRQYEEMMRRAPRLIDSAVDSLRVYFLNHQYAVRSFGVGARRLDDVIIL